MLRFQKFIFTLLICCFASLKSFASAEVIYGVSPFYFSRGYDVTFLPELSKRLPEIKELGATIIWIQPLNLSHEPGQSYDVTDHFTVNSDYGTDADLENLIKSAHAKGLRVILDVALNHTSLHHPFAKDVMANGMTSKYFGFYQSSINMNTPYSEHAHVRLENNFPFTYYFWDSLVNLNYDNPEVREYALSVLEHWVRRFDVDGFRFDASWGPQSRWPEFYKTVNSRLRKIKPTVFLLAEDKAGYPARYEESRYPHLRGSGFDAAYDWNAADPDWLSKWNFQTGDSHGETLFNMEDPAEAAALFLDTIRQSSARETVSPVRYLENNDTASFSHSHSPEQVKFAAKLMYLLPGTPLLFYGQPMGFNYDQWRLPSIDPSRMLSSYDAGLWAFYRDLLKLRKSNPALMYGKIKSAVKIGKYTVLIRVESAKDAAKIYANFANKSVQLR
jgi:glycosidase